MNYLRTYKIGHLNGGFTLLEVIASIVLIGLIAALMGTGLVAAAKNYEFMRANVHLSQKAQSTMTRISREIMELTLVEAISGTGDHPFIIYHRTDPSNNQETIRYALHYDTTTRTLFLYTGLSSSIVHLDENTTGNGDILANNVNRFALDYYAGSTLWSWGSDPRLLSSVHVDLELTRPDNPSRTFDLSTIIHLRNTNNFGGAAPTSQPASRDDYNCFIKTIAAHQKYF